MYSSIFSGSIKSARVLLENGACLQLKNRLVDAAFHLAMKFENTKVIKLALEFQPNLLTALLKFREELFTRIYPSTSQ